TALERGDAVVRQVRELYRERRDALIAGLGAVGWAVEAPMATMFVWAPIPERFRAEGSVAFAMRLLEEARVAVAPGIAFGAGGDGFVRFALVEEVARIQVATSALAAVLR